MLCAEISQLVSSTDKRGQGRNHVISLLRRDMQIGCDTGVLSIDMKRMHALHVCARTIPVTALLTEADSSQFAQLEPYPLDKVKSLHHEKASMLVSGDGRIDKTRLQR